jgi:hypothetical protein
VTPQGISFAGRSEESQAACFLLVLITSDHFSERRRSSSLGRSLESIIWRNSTVLSLALISYLAPMGLGQRQ